MPQIVRLAFFPLAACSVHARAVPPSPPPPPPAAEIVVTAARHVLALPEHTLVLQRLRMGSVFLEDDGSVVVANSRIAMIHADGRIDREWDTPFANVDEQGNVTFAASGQRIMELGDDGLVRVIAPTRTNEVDMTTYLAPYPRHLWRVIELAFFIDVVITGTML